jgi:polysaccharide pyruvyl transferase WcaK-like protein
MIVSIVNGFGLTSNVGDLALLPATINIVRSGFPKARIYVIPWQQPTIEMRARFENLTKCFNDVKLINSVLPAYSGGQGFPDSTFANKVKIIAWTIWKNLQAEVQSRIYLKAASDSPFELLKRSDLVVLRGCNIVQRGTDVRTLATVRRVTFPLLVAQKSHHPTALANISVGPIEHPIARRMVKEVLERADYVSTRERMTDKYLDGLINNNLIASCDSVFAFPYEALHVAYEPMMIGINVLSRGEYLTAVNNSKSGYEGIIGKLASEINKLMEELPELKIKAIPHEVDEVPLTSDLISLKFLLEKLKYPQRVQIDVEARTPNAVIQAYSRCEFAIGMRFHGFVLSSLANTPMLGIDVKSRKVTGVAGDLGLEDMLIDLEEEGNLTTQVKRALLNTESLHEKLQLKTSRLRRQVFEQFAVYAKTFRCRT